MTPPKYSRGFVNDLIKAKQLAHDLVPLLNDLVTKVISENAENEVHQEALYSASNPAPEGAAVGVTATIRWKDSQDEKQVYFSFEEIDPVTHKTPSGVADDSIFFCCTLKEFILGFPTEPFELV